MFEQQIMLCDEQSVSSVALFYTELLTVLLGLVDVLSPWFNSAELGAPTHAGETYLSYTQHCTTENQLVEEFAFFSAKSFVN